MPCRDPAGSCWLMGQPYMPVGLNNAAACGNGDLSVRLPPAHQPGPKGVPAVLQTAVAACAQVEEALSSPDP